MNIAQVDSAISKASRLMNEDFMRRVDNVEAMRKGKPVKGGNDLAYLDQQVFGRSSSKTNSYVPQQMQENIPQHQFNNSFLQESFSQQPPISGYSFPGAESMGMSQSGYQPGASLLTEQRSQQPYVQQPQQVYQPQYQPQQTGGINYDMIKYLVSEAIKENMEVIRQSMLNENAMAGIRMPGGNKIQFLDSKGNVYEGQLVLKKRKQ